MSSDRGERVRRREGVRRAVRVDEDPTKAIQDELAVHVRALERRLIAQGASPEEARLRAHEEFGDLEHVQSSLEESARRALMGETLAAVLEGVRQDLAYAFRGLRRRPAFSAVALLTLTLGIGGTGAAFTLLDQVLLSPLPFGEPDRLVRVFAESPEGRSNLGPGFVSAWEDGEVGLDAIAGLVAHPAALTSRAIPVRLDGARATASVFPTLALQPMLGRGFLQEEEATGGPSVVVLSHRVWRTHFDEDPQVVGSTVILSGEPRTVIGVLPSSLDVLAPGDSDPTQGLAAVLAPDFLIPLQLPADQWSNFGGGWLTVVARLSGTTTSEAATMRLESVLARLGIRNADGTPISVGTIAVQTELTDPARRPLWILMGTTTAVLLLACLNLANLLLAQGTTRVREMAVRASLGAGRGRLVRQLITESIVLGLIGGAGGFLVARAGVDALTAFTSMGLPRAGSASSGLSTLLFCMCVSLATGVAFGIVPAWRSGRLQFSVVLRGSGLDHAHGPTRTRWALVFGEVALVVALLIGSGLMLRSAHRLASEVRGWDPDVVTAQLTLPWALYPSETDAMSALDAMVAALRVSPGVDAAAYSSRVPLAGNSFGADVAVAAQAFGLGNDRQAALRIASPGYFSALGMEFSEGRDFEQADDALDTRRVVVNEALVEALEIGDPLSALLKVNVSDFNDVDGAPMLYAIIGVMRDVRGDGLRSSAVPEVYFTPRGIPAAPWNWIGRELVLAARTASDPRALPQLLRTTVSSVAPELPIYNVKSLRERDADALAIERLTTALLTTLGGLSLILTIAGIYGVVSYLVRQRTREIGLRMALGSSQSAVRALVIRQTTSPVLAGALAGVAVAVSLSWTLDNLLYEVSRVDPLTIVVVLITVLGAALAATYVPAREASRVDPTQALTAD